MVFIETIVKFRHNVMNISSIKSFAHIKGGFNNGCKDVYFVKALGRDSGTLKDIEDMDKSLGTLTLNGKGFYKRVNILPNISLSGDTTYYSECYNKWIDSGQKEISIKMPACKNTNFRKILSEACIAVGKIYTGEIQQANSSMLKNFIVKVLFWFDFLFNTEKFIWNEKLNSKIVTGNVTKKQEYLFWYAVTLTGSDVLMLQCQSDIQLEKQIDKLSLKFTLGAFSDIKIPEYQTNIITSTTSEHNYNKIKMVIPKHSSRNVDKTENKRELSYEQLAKLASSVVLIEVHNNSGDITSLGSGIMIGKKGFILTNNHVTGTGSFFSVRIENDDNTYITDELIKYNPILDLSVIRIQRELVPLPVYNGRQKLARGQKVVAIGSPLGLFNTVSDGIISAFRNIDTVDMIQFTAPISHGSSGGALLNMYGEVIGISSGGFDDGQNINLAVRYEHINQFIRGMIT